MHGFITLSDATSYDMKIMITFVVDDAAAAANGDYFDIYLFMIFVIMHLNLKRILNS